MYDRMQSFTQDDLQMRIPLIPASDSSRSRPLIPRDPGRRFQMIAARLSERSDAVICPLPRSRRLRQVCLLFSHRFSVKFYFVGAMYQSVENSIGKSRVADLFVPVLDGQLTGNER